MIPQKTIFLKTKENIMNIKNLNWHVAAGIFVVLVGGLFYVLYSNQKKMLGFQEALQEEVLEESTES